MNDLFTVRPVSLFGAFLLGAATMSVAACAESTGDRSDDTRTSALALEADSGVAADADDALDGGVAMESLDARSAELTPEEHAARYDREPLECFRGDEHTDTFLATPRPAIHSIADARATVPLRQRRVALARAEDRASETERAPVEAMANEAVLAEQRDFVASGCADDGASDTPSCVQHPYRRRTLGEAAVPGPAFGDDAGGEADAGAAR